MGLDVSHGAFNGAYSAFNRLRQAVAKAVGGSYPPHSNDSFDPGQWYWEPDDIPDGMERGIELFLSHSDSGGFLCDWEAYAVGTALNSIVDRVDGDGGGHISAAGGLSECVKRFANGCLTASRAGERLEFS